MPITDLTGTTWVLNDTPDLTSLRDNVDFYPVSLEFISNEQNFDSFGYSDSEDDGLWYGSVLAYVDRGWSKEWSNEAYKTISITGGSYATHSSLISWLESNATLIPSVEQVTVDLSTLTGWSSVSAGTHTLKVKAKATGYRDSALSTGVSFGKAFSLAVVVTNGSYTGDTSIMPNGTASITIVPNSGYTLPANVAVSGASYTYNSSTGVISLSNPTGVAGAVMVSAACTEGGYALTVREYSEGGSFDITYANGTTDNVGSGEYSGVRSIDDVHYTASDAQSYYIDGSYSVTFPYILSHNTEVEVRSQEPGFCFIKGTQISLADGTTKAIEDISANDDILVWDFDNGELSSAKPAVVYDLGKVRRYEKLTFSDGSICSTIKHRLFNVDEGKFTYSTSDQFPIGSKTLNKDGEIIELVSREIITLEEPIEYYNMRTKYYIDYFIDGVLSGTRLANIYPIENLKYVKDDREIKPYENFPRLTYDQYIDCRVGEQPEINRDGDVNLGDNDIQDYILRNAGKNII